MEKRAIGIFILVLGLTGCFMAGYRFMNGSGDMQNLIEVLIYSVGGCVLFFWGIDYVSISLRSNPHKHSHTFPEQES